MKGIRIEWLAVMEAIMACPEVSLERRPCSLERMLNKWVLVIFGNSRVDLLFRGLSTGGLVTSIPTVVVPAEVGWARVMAISNGRSVGRLSRTWVGSRRTSKRVRTRPARGARRVRIWKSVSRIWLWKVGVAFLL